MDPKNVERLFALASVAEPVELNFLYRPQPWDPADELILEAAVNGREGSPSRRR
jgi:hypothetical protein